MKNELSDLLLFLRKRKIDSEYTIGFSCHISHDYYA